MFNSSNFFSTFNVSEFKRRPSDSFFKYLLMLSGDINLNPGPVNNPCKVCQKPVRQRVIYCKDCKFWFHKKCENPAENIYKELIESDQRKSDYICTSCCNNPNNLLENLPFFTEENLDLPDCHVIDDEENDAPDDLNANENFRLFKTRGLHFLHLNINSILSKIEELKLIAHNSNAAIIGISETKLDNTVLDNEIEIQGYKILRSWRRRCMLRQK